MIMFKDLPQHVDPLNRRLAHSYVLIGNHLGQVRDFRPAEILDDICGARGTLSRANRSIKWLMDLNSKDLNTKNMVIYPPSLGYWPDKDGNWWHITRREDRRYSTGISDNTHVLRDSMNTTQRLTDANIKTFIALFKVGGYSKMPDNPKEVFEKVYAPVYEEIG